MLLIILLFESLGHSKHNMPHMENNYSSGDGWL